MFPQDGSWHHHIPMSVNELHKSLENGWSRRVLPYKTFIVSQQHTHRRTGYQRWVYSSGQNLHACLACWSPGSNPRSKQINFLKKFQNTGKALLFLYSWNIIRKIKICKDFMRGDELCTHLRLSMKGSIWSHSKYDAFLLIHCTTSNTPCDRCKWPHRQEIQDSLISNSPIHPWVDIPEDTGAVIFSCGEFQARHH